MGPMSPMSNGNLTRVELIVSGAGPRPRPCSLLFFSQPLFIPDPTLGSGNTVPTPRRLKSGSPSAALPPAPSCSQLTPGSVPCSTEAPDSLSGPQNSDLSSRTSRPTPSSPPSQLPRPRRETQGHALGLCLPQGTRPLPPAGPCTRPLPPDGHPLGLCPPQGLSLGRLQVFSFLGSLPRPHGGSQLRLQLPGHCQVTSSSHKGGGMRRRNGNATATPSLHLGVRVRTAWWRRPRLPPPLHEAMHVFGSSLTPSQMTPQPQPSVASAPDSTLLSPIPGASQIRLLSLTPQLLPGSPLQLHRGTRFHVPVSPSLRTPRGLESNSPSASSSPLSIFS